jgi:two-component system CitB family sensor kinase
MRAWMHRWSIATRLFVLQLTFVAALMAAVVCWVWVDVSAAVEQDAASRSLSIARSVAVNPFVVDALATNDPTASLEPYTLHVMAGTSIDFITIMALDRTRYTHPNPAEIGKSFEGTIAPALRGKSLTETYTGTLGPSVRAVVPIRNAEGRIIALVSAGVEVSNVTEAFRTRLPIIFVAAGATVLLGAIAAWLLSRYLRRVTWGRGPDEMSRMFSYYEGVLHSVSEGLILVDTRGRVVLYNDQAAELLDLPRPGDDGVIPTPVTDLDLPPALRRVLGSGARAEDEVHLTRDRILVVNQEVVRSGIHGRTLRVTGTVATVRDHTELRRLSDELKTMRTLSDALRSQTHEFSNRMHTIVSLIELGRSDEALRFAANELDVGQQLADQLVGSIDEPVLAALLLGKSAQAAERGIVLRLDVDPELGLLSEPANDLVTIIGNLIDNAMDAAVQDLDEVRPRNDLPAVSVRVARDTGGDLQIRVSDNGQGIPDVENAFRRGFSTKSAGDGDRGIGLALVRQAVNRLGGTIDAGSDGGAVFTVRLPDAERVSRTQASTS